MRGSQRMKIIRLCVLALLILTIAGSAANAVLNRNGGGEAPAIKSTEDKISVPCKYTGSDLLQGMTASDEEDGDLTDRIMIGNFSGFKSRGVADLNYMVYDSDGNNDACTREVQFRDYKPPKISFNSPCVFFARESGSGDLKQNTRAYDMLDGDVTKRVRITKTDADFKEPGKYTFSVYVFNSFGDEVTMDFPVHILDPAQKGNTVSLAAAIEYLGKGAAFHPEDYFNGVTNDNTGSPLPPDSYTLTVDSDVDSSKEGMYEVHYSAASSDGSLLAETWLIVVVGDYGG